MSIDLKSLHPLEIKLLRYAQGELRADRATAELGMNIGQYNQATSWLLGKGLIRESARSTRTLFELTELGHQYRASGAPDELILRVVGERGPLTLPEIAQAAGIEPKEIGSAYGQLAKEGLVSMDESKRVARKGGEPSRRIAVVRGLLERAAKVGALEEESLGDEERQAVAAIARKRGVGSAPFKVAEREEVVYRLTPAGEQTRKSLLAAGAMGDEIGQLTSGMLASGSWKGKSFRGYNIATPAARIVPGRRNPYAEFLQWVKDKLVSLGFEEFDGPLVETEFWNGDALFMPQFHSARDIHDVYYVREPHHAREIEQPWLDRVAAAHENGGGTGSRGWGYAFDRDFTRKLILRSQGTVLSAKQLPKAKIPGKYFGIVRCFRYDQVDATHGADFYQTEGIVLGEDVNLRTLLGLLKMFAEEVAGATEVKYVPGYFPFTEPSIEVHIKHPKLGWFELGGSGIFRPEVTEPLGVKVPVLAWGLGIDRMALMQLGLSDLRELFTGNIESVRLRRRS